AGEYNGFNSSLSGWTVTIANDTPDSFSDLQRTDGTTTFAATWQPGDNNSPGFWNNTVAQ
ncbi:MAG TPA: hypothetical protein VI728_11960, partial [Syntrophales bacterium]|nr:hypothetical protein [Syntrophales bacterium]